MVQVKLRKRCFTTFFCLCVKIAILVALRILYGPPKTMRKDLLHAAGKEVVKDRKQVLDAFFML